MLLHAVLIEPARGQALGAAEWDLLVRQARHANLLGRLGARLREQAWWGELPQKPRNHLQSALVLAERQQQGIRSEVRHLQRIAERVGTPLILLKGAAYVAAGLAAAPGRVFGDVDILVPRSALDAWESELLLNGWTGTALSAYDQRYYRRWMHELPPMQHSRRGSALDVHHTILPPTAHAGLNPQLLLDASVAVPGCEGVRVLEPADMVLHSAAHLFHEGEPDNLLRDLSDLDLLLRQFGTAADFWPRLQARAEVLGLQRPLALALRYTGRLLQTPLGVPVADTAERLDALYLPLFRSTHDSCADRFTPWACRWLYVRSHWLRMPPHLLSYHLLRKALSRAETRSLTDQ